MSGFTPTSYVDLDAMWPLTEREQAWINTLFNTPTEKEGRVRKEYRLLSTREREELHQAFNALKSDTVRNF
jgi:hypothetical protein